jgi:hypothetical protein
MSELTTPQRLERLEQAIAELDYQFCHAGSRYGWRPEHRAALSSLREGYDAERQAEYDRQVTEHRAAIARSREEAQKTVTWTPS